MSSIQYTVRSPWKWVLERVALDSDIPLEYCSAKSKLVSSMLQPTPNTRRKLKKGGQVSTVCFDLMDKTGRLLDAYHGSSAALDGLEDKDELVRTFQRCRADHLGLTPPSSLIKWDVTLIECQNMIKSLPTLESNSNHGIAVLKEPIGSRGEGIYFVSSVQEIYNILEQHRNQAKNEGGGFLDAVMEQKGRIPSWVLQAEIYPPLLISEQRKFHIRSYVVAIECLEEDHLVNLYIYNRHEVRIASLPVADAESDVRDPRAHITNGAAQGGMSTERVLLSAVPELASRATALEHFCATACSSLLPDITRRVGYTAQEQPPEIQKHIMAGLDIMMTTDYRFYILEVNVNPAAPPQEACPPEFATHLVDYMKDMKNLILGHGAPNFMLMEDVLARGPA